ncbi:amidohydrolase family protein [Helcobacillus massiliensis]|uniref:amidohydrolase family protein n=1 Tax=Helcobacillus massiliensis TaxID=521392 RepID=UPI0021A65820|nr:amidohydrolase family protein [Helcobacillus massiliensis]MCT1557820.1 amidohydrolase family protein [Helcobacillus massiliensis]MCT2036684.1 amidohydrolase family protein [Helcobacillus massiliensis]MCT2332155.1 amidohydrolase family protein [Helcobacillus massiliensis]
MLLRTVRLIDPVGPSPAYSRSAAPVDVRIVDGRITEIAERLSRTSGEQVVDAAGAFAIPGLWDQHVHVGQTAQGRSRLDTSGATSLDDLLGLARRALAARRAQLAGSAVHSGDALVGFGHRLVDFDDDPHGDAFTRRVLTELDALAPATAIVLIGSDAHHALMNTAALTGLGLPTEGGVVGEDEWFTALEHLDDLPGIADRLEGGVADMQTEALERGIVGLVDMEWAANWELWARRAPRLRVRTATYASTLESVPGPTGTPIPAADAHSPLVTMGPLKVIVDGALGSKSALCRHAYGAPDGDGRGVLAVPLHDLHDLLGRARGLGLHAAVHAIGDAAADIALDAIQQAGIPARIEHAQMLTDQDVARMARLGVTASVQPVHLLDDRDATMQTWGDWADCAYRLRDLLEAGVPLAFGSDAPVAPIAPWMAMAAAVHRSSDERPGWFPAQQLQPLEALAASVDGVQRLQVGGLADLVLLEDDPFAPVPTGPDGLMVESAAREAAERLLAVRPLSTFVDGIERFSR